MSARAFEKRGPDFDGLYKVGQVIDGKWETECAFHNERDADRRVAVLNSGKSLNEERLAALEARVLELERFIAKPIEEYDGQTISINDE